MYVDNSVAHELTWDENHVMAACSLAASCSGDSLTSGTVEVGADVRTAAFIGSIEGSVAVSTAHAEGRALFKPESSMYVHNTDCLTLSISSVIIVSARGSTGACADRRWCSRVAAWRIIRAWGLRSSLTNLHHLLMESLDRPQVIWTSEAFSWEARRCL
jgi:hypothetical protein